MTRRRSSLDRLLSDSLEGYADQAPLPEATMRVPDSWVRGNRVRTNAVRGLAALTVVVIATLATSAALADRGGSTGLGDEVTATASPESQASPEVSPSPVDATIPAAEATPFVPDRPPSLALNGIAGHPFAWCYGNVCVDGVYTMQPLDTLPGVSAPFTALPGEPALIEEVIVVGAGGIEAPVALDGSTIGAIPAGSWERIVVVVRFTADGDAAYVWRLDSSEGQ